MAEKSPWAIDDDVITPQILDAVKHVESRGNVNAVSHAGARGPYQFMPATAKQYGLVDPHDEPSAREAAGRYLTDLSRQFGGDVDKALLAYNWGPGNVKKGGSMPLEAQQYVGKVRMAEQKGNKAPEAAPWEVDDTSPWEVDDTPTKKEALPKAVQKENSLLDEGKRQAGLTGRYVLEAAGSVPAVIGNVLAKVPGLEGMRGNAGTSAANYLGLPTADREGEKLVSEVVQTLAPGAGGYKAGVKVLEKALSKAPKILRGPLAQSVVGGGAGGAAGAAALDQDIGEGTAWGAALGPAGKLVGDVANAIPKGYRRLFGGAQDDAARYVRELAGGGEQAVKDAATLRALRGEVAGEAPLPGIAAVSNPELEYAAEIQRQSAARDLTGRHTTIARANDAAREAPLERIAATGRKTFNPQTSKKEPSFAQGERSRVTGPMYDRSMGDRVDLDPNLRRILEGEEVLPATRQGGRQFSQEQTNAAVGGRNVPQGRTENALPPQLMRDPSTGAPYAGQNVPFMPDKGSVSIQELQGVRKALDSKISQAVEKHDDATVERLMTVRSQLTGEMTGQSGNFALANTTFKNMSQPQNAGEVADVMVKALRERGSKGLVEASDNATRTLKRADQSSRFQHIGEVFDKGQLQDVNASVRSARRQAAFDSDVPRINLPKFTSFAKTLEGDAPGLLNRGITIIKKVLSKVGAATEEQVYKQLDEAALNPTRFAELLERVPASERDTIIDIVRRRNPKGVITGVIAGQAGEE